MKKITLFLFFAFLFVAVCAGGARAEQTLFFSALQDVPLMPGLAEMSDQTVIFDKPGGRIIESVADMGGVPRAGILSYYADSLPQFGWKPAGRGRFVRDSEILELKFQKLGEHEFLRISVMPEHAVR